MDLLWRVLISEVDMEIQIRVRRCSHVKCHQPLIVIHSGYRQVALLLRREIILEMDRRGRDLEIHSRCILINDQIPSTPDVEIVTSTSYSSSCWPTAVLANDLKVVKYRKGHKI